MGAPKSVTVVTNHMPLLGSSTSPSAKTPTSGYSVPEGGGGKCAAHLGGVKHNLIADILSNAPVLAAAPLDEGKQQEEAVFVPALGDV